MNELMGKSALVYGSDVPKRVARAAMYQEHTRIHVTITKVRGERVTVRDDCGYTFAVREDQLASIQ